MIICRSFKFDAAHFLPCHEGKCHKLHGHRWKVDVAVGGEELVNGILIDFADLKEIVNKIIDIYDHELLNNFFENPTAETLAKHIYDMLTVLLPPNIYPYFVRVWESEDSFAQEGFDC